MSEKNNPNRMQRFEARNRKKVVAELLESGPEYITKVKCDTTSWTRPFKCAVLSCRNVFKEFNPNARHKYHNFPTDPEWCKLWFKQCKLNSNFNPSSAKVCTDHFVPNNYERNYKMEMTNPDFKRKLKADAIPTQHLDGLEVSIVEFSDANQATGDVPPRDEVVTLVNENENLKAELDRLTQERVEIFKKANDVDVKLILKKEKIVLYKSKLTKLKEKCLNINENKDLLSKTFSPAQINILLGRKKVFWSNDDMAMAFTLRHMGSKECYLYLKDTLQIPLPSLSSIQRWAAAK